MKETSQALLRPTHENIDSLIVTAEKQIREAILFIGILKESEEVTDMLRREKNNILSGFVHNCKRNGIPEDKANAEAQKLRTKFMGVDVPRYKEWCKENGLNYHDYESQNRWLREGEVNVS
jgi:hypothetical protein